MLYLNGLSLKARIGGTVTIFAVPHTPKYLGGTAHQRIIIENDRGDVIDVEDQMIEAEVR